MIPFFLEIGKDTTTKKRRRDDTHDQKRKT